MHRDIKLENILLDGHGRVKIGDFGVSRLLKHSNEILHTKCGTRVYFAPEIDNIDGYVGPPADIWSTGICLYSMIHGKLPDAADLIKFELEGAPP